MLLHLPPHAAHRQSQLSQAPRRFECPRLVAEVALDLPQDRRNRIGDEAHAARGIEAIQGKDEADIGDLNQILLGHRAAVEPARQVTDDPTMHEDEAGSQAGVTGGDELAQERLRIVRGRNQVGGVDEMGGSLHRLRLGSERDRRRGSGDRQTGNTLPRERGYCTAHSSPQLS